MTANNTPQPLDAILSAQVEQPAPAGVEPLPDNNAALYLVAFAAGIALLWLRDIRAGKARQAVTTGLLRNTEAPEERRRAQLAAHLSKTGWQVVSQGAGMLQVKRKTPFSLLIFLVLALISFSFFGLLGVLYILWYFVQKEKIETFVLDV